MVRTYPASIGGSGIISHGNTALLELVRPSVNFELVFFNAAHNTTRVIQSNVPGGVDLIPLESTFAGGSYFLPWVNYSTGNETWEKVSASGVVSTVNLPLGRGQFWDFIYGDHDSFYASSGVYLVEINATTLKIASNLTKLVPPSVSVNAVLPIADRLYLAGYQTLSATSSRAYFGYLNLPTKKVVMISKSMPVYSGNLFPVFQELISLRNEVYVGGSVTYETASPFMLSTNGTYFYRYVPSTSTFHDLSSLVPNATWGVFAIEPWGHTIALSLFGFEASQTSNYWISTVYTLSSSGTGLLNQTSVLPSGFWANNALPWGTAASNGWFFQIGYRDLVPAVVAVET